MGTEEFIIVKASLIAQGLIEELDDGIRITQKGKDAAWERWLRLDGEDRLLFGWLIKEQIS